jgi:hypothetical protein
MIVSSTTNLTICVILLASLPYLHRGWKTTEKGKRQGQFLHACREREAVENG